MSRIFVSHSSIDNAQAAALRDWLAAEGWNELFLDFDPQHGIAAGEQWEQALYTAAHRCEAVLFLISRAWLASTWCLNELTLARRLNKRLFGLMIEDGVSAQELPSDLTRTWQVVNLATGRDRHMIRTHMPVTGEETEVSFPREGLARLKNGLQKAGLHASYYAWPPEDDPQRPPYRGLRPLEPDDAGIYFGREAATIEAIDTLRGLRAGAAPRLLVVLGASGAGKSSFLRAGLWPRLTRDDTAFFPMPIVRPERAPISGDNGLVASLDAALNASGITISRVEVMDAVARGAPAIKPLLQRLVASRPRDADAAPPAIVIAIDQAEELFAAEAEEEAAAFLRILNELVTSDAPAIIAVFTIRSDNYERLQETPSLAALHQEILSLPPMPRGAYTDVIKGPLRRLDGTPREIKIQESLVDALLSDIEEGGAKDALPLLAFTLERLYDEYHATGQLRLEHYEKLGRVKGSIEAAVERAISASTANPSIPRDRPGRLELLRRGLIPWLAGVDPDTGAPRRRVARLSEIPIEARPLIDRLVDQHLLSTDFTPDGEKTVEPTHEALLRQWGLLQGWLAEDAGLLGVMEVVKRAARDWDANGKRSGWLTHTGDRLKTAEGLRGRPDLAGNFDRTDWDYLTACRKAEHAARRRRRRVQATVTTLLLSIIAGLFAYINREFLEEQLNWYWKMRPYMMANFRPHVLPRGKELALRSGDSFRECAKDCPELIVIPAGSFIMGSPATDEEKYPNEGPQRFIRHAQAFAVSKFHVTFDEWDACANVGGCPPIQDSGFGRGNRPAINMTWPEAQQYVAWLSRMTGQQYRLLSESEWEYAARAGAETRFTWGDDVGENQANCQGCGSEWDNRQTSPVGRFKPNAFGVYDAHGNVFQWMADCYENSLDGIPSNGAPRRTRACDQRVRRGGSWTSRPRDLRVTGRSIIGIDYRNYNGGLRVGRTLQQPPADPTQYRAPPPGLPPEGSHAMRPAR
ncbi:SUMF1/EgtB/PvdO family nonheme iron enzyme [Variibacter gotjawalensis]|nr:SUMF1/EgtB/PvdO family nonheme iron enzyme [Variibacter gotjawalensis]NIK48808.1 formylglycine-generating enzyme required for sulfatase activity [Variibacter gotjawalensis]